MQVLQAAELPYRWPGAIPCATGERSCNLSVHPCRPLAFASGHVKAPGGNLGSSWARPPGLAPSTCSLSCKVTLTSLVCWAAGGARPSRHRCPARRLGEL